MLHILPGGHVLAAFLLSSLLLAVTPGPAVIYIVARTLSLGRLAGLASVMAVVLGNLVNVLAAALGLAALFAVSSLAFAVMKYAGAAYLVYLGLRALRARPAAAAQAAPAAGGAGLRRVFRDGFVVALFNPKTTLFFAAFLPQFMDPAIAALPQSVALGGTFVLIAATTDCCYVLAAAALLPLLSRAGGAQAVGRYLTGGALIGLGVLAAVSGGRNIK
ncbi:LysE family translocator [Cupriavidus basilensis]|uniref:LysE family translocator n=1 Tax=Cupriavidus basilensis TaxID=68895 RepID=UPI00157AAD90|nr:LysE family translocator [Cupriavidus basilensis]NUA31531.1 LysE family translocator [Cupriavidus basilensis]